MFDYAAAMRVFIEDIVSSSDVFTHIDTEALLVGCVKARTATGTGLYARTVPLRFEKGALTVARNGAMYRIPRVLHQGVEMLYIISFCLPRFQDLAFEDKITTVFHELYHISPRFDGDIRRFEGMRYVHSPSQKKYDELMRRLAHDYLSSPPRPELYEFLKLSYAELCIRYGGVRMTIYRTPKPQLVEPVSMPATARKGKPQ